MRQLAKRKGIFKVVFEMNPRRIKDSEGKKAKKEEREGGEERKKKGHRKKWREKGKKDGHSPKLC